MTRTLNILVACEESQTVCKAFRALGHRAFSCDLQDCSGGHPEWHVNGDCLPLLNGDCEFTTCDGTAHRQQGEWDLLVCHPPCTYMTGAGARWLYPNHVLNEERLALAMDGKRFFLQCLNAKCKHIAVENPRPMKVVELPPPNAVDTALSIRRAIQQAHDAMATRTASTTAYGSPARVRAVAVEQILDKEARQQQTMGFPVGQSQKQDLRRHSPRNGRAMERVYHQQPALTF